MRFDWKNKLKHLGRIEKTFCVLLLLYVPLALLRPDSALVALAQVLLFFLGLFSLIKLANRGMRKAIWRVRNRLLATLLFFAVVPVFLLMILAGIGGYALFSQLAVYLAMSDLDRRTATLRDIAESLAESDSRLRPEVMDRLARVHLRRFPGLTMITRNGTSLDSWPPRSNPQLPPDGWNAADGIVMRANKYYLWAHAIKNGTRATVLFPLSRAFLSSMVPGLGDISILEYGDERGSVVVGDATGRVRHLKSSHEPMPVPLPPAYSRFDVEMHWFSTLAIWRWESPGSKDPTLLLVQTRPSAVLGTIYNAKIDSFENFLPIALLVISILFLIVEAAALVIGVSLARTITSAVHNLYEGTQRVIQGDFSHRIAVHGKDQLATLSTSFNSMTENLEQLLVVAKEKERLQAELEIAREVQNQLYPKVLPQLGTLRLTAICKPARMVSGDYYDYLELPEGRLALAIGDVAGKGISAALLMATIQSALRMELRAVRALAAPGGTGFVHVPTARIVSDLNQQLFATTAPEKFATFFFAMYDDLSGSLSYTNAGHLPPFLVSQGKATPLEVSGTVVGAFPTARYEENRIRMESGDLLLCYTDGITEPENEYGEMFGEERLIDVVIRNSDCEDSKIVSLILEAVQHWTSAKEQPDDMTLLLARKV